jgi:uncharacterized protein (TIGR02996 family)
MTDHDALLSAVLLAPEDDAPRLVMADWLTENGQDKRATAIRLAVRSFRAPCYFVEMGDCPLPCAEHYRQPGMRGRPQRWCPRCTDAERAANLCHENEADWLAPWPLWVPGAEWEWSRGFVGSVSLPTAAFLANAADLFRRHPAERVTLTDREPYIARAKGTKFYYWSRESWLSRDALPPPIWKGLLGWAGESTSDPESMRGYPTRDAALAALSAACCRYGRELAGLTEPARG